MFPEEVLDAPEATCSDGAFLRVGGRILSSRLGVERKMCRSGEGAEKSVKEGHCGCHDDGEDRKDESCSGELQVYGCIAIVFRMLLDVYKGPECFK